MIYLRTLTSINTDVIREQHFANANARSHRAERATGQREERQLIIHAAVEQGAVVRAAPSLQAHTRQLMASTVAPPYHGAPNSRSCHVRESPHGIAGHLVNNWVEAYSATWRVMRQTF